MPTICSACGRTSGKCESCIKVDAIIDVHENQTARIIMRRALKAMTPDEPAAPPPVDSSSATLPGYGAYNPQMIGSIPAPAPEPEPYRSGGGGKFGGGGASSSYESSSSCDSSSSSSDSGSCSSSD